MQIYNLSVTKSISRTNGAFNDYNGYLLPKNYTNTSIASNYFSLYLITSIRYVYLVVHQRK